MAVHAQESRPGAATESDKPTHGIIRKARPKNAEPVKQSPPVATTDAAAAAIAAAVRTVEETKKPAAASPRPARRVEPRAPVRRYEIRWPSQRFEVEWATHDERVSLSWQEVVPAEPQRTERGPEP
jgi:hypothetical protein